MIRRTYVSYTPDYLYTNTRLCKTQDSIPCCIRVFLSSCASLSPVCNFPVTLISLQKNAQMTMLTNDEGKVVFKPLMFGKYIAQVAGRSYEIEVTPTKRHPKLKLLL